jgi:mannose-6-phosphate isomerase-like protein (cupin superfamily)
MTATTQPVATPVMKSVEDVRAFRISKDDTNYFACLADPVGEGVDFTILVEIDEPGGATPPNTHRAAYEFFYILEGTGRGKAGGVEVDLAPGSSLLVPPGTEHIVENTGSGKLYALCVMVPNEEFAEMIHGGETVALSDTDRAVLKRTLQAHA